MFHYTVETVKSIEVAIASLESNLKKEKFGVLWHLDLQQKLREKELDYDQKYNILEVCNPVEAKRILSDNALVGYFLPCKIIVYENQGQTKIGMPKPTSLIGMVDRGYLQGIAEDVEKRLISCIDKSV
ncbi:DUF302 domain-containing protein [Paenibacillus vini]|uniref:DUF302 domain-containing protein n=1 Tax=Paenibacillus vini TaxID=1476024 RepID=UPI0025B6C039|nr:DUF302 domain-containing protein [Paenibacillus vini]MDN4067607.1 DUF302 domain-containing protein [Paenibacillus vini]